MEVEAGNIFDRTQTAWEDGKRVIVHKGGTGCFSGETLVRTEFGIKFN